MCVASLALFTISFLKFCVYTFVKCLLNVLWKVLFKELNIFSLKYIYKDTFYCKYTHCKKKTWNYNEINNPHRPTVFD